MKINFRNPKKLGAGETKIITVKELHTNTLEEAGVHANTIVRINEHGDIEVRRKERWDVIGGLLGNYEERIKQVTGLNWAT